MKGSACLAITWRLSSSFCKKIWPRLSIMVFTSSIVLDSSFGEARVMKQINSSLAEHTEVMGFPLFLRIVTADLMVLTSSWIVVTLRDRPGALGLWKKWGNDETHSWGSPGHTRESWWRLCHSTCSCPPRLSLGSTFQSLCRSSRIITDLTLKLFTFSVSRSHNP